MALNPKTSTTARNAAANAISALANSGKLRIYDGTQPADSDTAVSTQTLLAELTLNATAFGAASGGVITANPITGATAVATSTATWFRVLKSDGTTSLFDGSVGTSGCNLNLTGTAVITSGLAVNVTALTYTEPA